MSVQADAQVQIILADYAGTDAAGKLNVIGGGLTLMALSPEGASPPLSCAVTVSVPAKHAGADFALSVELHDVTLGKIVQVPSPDGSGLQALRVQQVVTLGALSLPPGFVRPTDVQIQHVLVMNFPAGLPLTAGSSYEWRAQIDGQSIGHGWYRFHVLRATPGVVFGGPAGPATIPGVQTPPPADR